MIKLISVLFGGYLSFALITQGEFYAGMLVFISTYAFTLKLAATSICGDLSKTAKGIVEKRNNSVTYSRNLPTKERLALRAEYRRQGTQFIETGRVGHSPRAKYKKHQQHAIVAATLTSCSTGVDTSPPPMDIANDSDDNVINAPLELTSLSTDDMAVNPTTGLPMMGGMGGVDSSGHFWGETDSFMSDSLSSFDDSSSSFCDSDSFGCDMADW